MDISTESITNKDSQIKKRFLTKTYRFKWEKVQEFYLPTGCLCTSVAVNPVMGEIMFACRCRGLLHYAWNKDNGVVYANKPVRISYNTWGNVRLVRCEQESGCYAVVNNNTMALIMVGYQQLITSSPQPLVASSALMADESKTSNANNAATESKHNHHQQGAFDEPIDKLATVSTQPTIAQPDTPAEGVSGNANLTSAEKYRTECVDYESERCSVGPVRDLIIDTENEKIYLLYKDRICRRLFPDMRGYTEAAGSESVNKCIGSELACLAHSN